MLRQIWKEKGNSRYRHWLFSRLLLLLGGPLFIVGVLSWYSYDNNQQTRNELLLRSTQQQVEKQIESVFTSLRDYYLNVFKSEEFNWLTYTPAVPYNQPSNIQTAQEMLRGGSYLTRYVSNYVFINVYEGWVLDRYGMFPYGEAVNLEELDAFVQQQTENPLTFYWLNRLDVESSGSHGNKAVDLSGELLVIKLSSAAHGIKSLLIVQLDPYELQALLDAWQPMGYQVTLLDREKQLVAATDWELASAQLEQGLPTRPTRIRYNMQQYLATARPISANGFYYEVASDPGGVDAPALALHAAVFAGSAVVVLLLCLLGTAIFYSPIRALLANVSAIFGAREHEQDEFSYLESGVQRLGQHCTSLQMMVEQQQEQLKSLFGLHLLRGELSTEKIKKTLEDLGLPHYQGYRLIACSCLRTDVEAVDAEREALLMTVKAALDPALEESCYLPPLISDGLLIFLVGDNDQDALDIKAAELCGELRQPEEQLSYRAAVGVSTVVDELAKLHTAYNEAREALQTSTGKRDGQPVYYLPVGGEVVRQPYDIVLERELTTAVNNCDSRECDRLLQRFLQQMEEQQITGRERTFWLYRIVVAILRVASDAGISTNLLLAGRKEDPFERLGRLYGTAELYDYLMEEVAVPVILLLSQRRQQTQPDLVQQIITLIKQTRGDITLSECADQLGYHPSYIWKVLKNQCNATFTDFVSREKLELAKELLVESDATVAEISDRLHYSNVQNFIRFFGREVGMTPGKYRKQNKPRG